MRAAIAAFVKTPGLSALKTRLAVDIGEERALAFYRLSVKAVEAVMRRVDATPHWAVAEEEGLDNPLWSEFKTLHTGGSDLGAAQHGVYKTLRLDFEKIIMVGADTPQLSPDIITGAISALEDYDFVVGPARDGGYYLFGGRVPVPKNVWENVPWSADNTREVFEALLPSKPFHLPMLTDVDEAGDLKHMAREMPSQQSPEQQEFRAWVSSL